MAGPWEDFAGNATVAAEPVSDSGPWNDFAASSKPWEDFKPPPPSTTPAADQAAAEPSFVGRVAAFARSPSPAWMQPVENFIKTPLVSAETIVPFAQADQGLPNLQALRQGKVQTPSQPPVIASPIGQGIAQGVGEAASQFTSPGSLALLPLIPEGMAGKAVAVGFTAQGLAQYPDLYKQYQATNDPKEKARILATAVTLVAPAAGLLSRERAPVAEAPSAAPPVAGTETFARVNERAGAAVPADNPAPAQSTILESATQPEPKPVVPITEQNAAQAATDIGGLSYGGVQSWPADTGIPSTLEFTITEPGKETTLSVPPGITTEELTARRDQKLADFAAAEQPQAQTDWAAESEVDKAAAVGLNEKVVNHPDFENLKSLIDKKFHRSTGQAYESNPQYQYFYLTSHVADKIPAALKLQEKIAADSGVSIRTSNTSLFQGRSLDIPEPESRIKQPTGEQTNASSEPSATGVSSGEVRGGVDEGAPLQQQGETAPVRPQGTERSSEPQQTQEAPVTDAEPHVSAIANRFVQERAAKGEIGAGVPGQGASTADLVQRGLRMPPERAAEAVSRVMQGAGTSIDDAAAIRGEEARLSQRSNQLSRSAQANPKDLNAQVAADNAFKDLTDFHNGPVARLKNDWHAQGMAMQGEIPVDLSTLNGLREKWLKDTGEAPPASIEPTLKRAAERVSQTVAEEKRAMQQLSNGIDKATRSRKFPTADEVRANIRERLGLGPCEV